MDELRSRWEIMPLRGQHRRSPIVEGAPTVGARAMVTMVALMVGRLVMGPVEALTVVHAVGEHACSVWSVDEGSGT